MYLAQKILAQKTIGGKIYYKIKWDDIGGRSFPDSWTRGDGVSEALKDHFYQFYTKTGTRRKVPLANRN